MPKQQINTPWRRTVSTHTRDNGLPEGHVAFGWAKEGDRLHDGQHWEDTPVLFVNWDSAGIESSVVLTMEVNADEVLRAAEAIQQSRRRYEQGAGTPLVESWPFSTAAIERSEAQKLIATTRRARNAVFGGDE